ncbi:hypothetical protein IJ182_07375 [bacterium]|nr:hypothetical protein [bacterium]
MIKFVLIIIIILNFNIVCLASDVSFIYINGSNNNNIKMKNWYEDGVKKLHPVLVKNFQSNKKIEKYYKKLNNININKAPVIFFWGYNSKTDLNYVKNKNRFHWNAPFAYFAKKIIIENLHDAIWIQKPNNMLPVLDELNTTIKKEVEKGNNVVLYGYSAGAFITYEYMFNKLRYINLQEFFKNLNADNDIKMLVKNYPQNNTCMAALLKNNADIGSLSPSGDFILNTNKKLLKNNYLKLNEITENVCAPNKNVIGVVNFANPLPLFYSDLFDDKYELNYYNRLMTKYILENDMFLISVNFKEDPLGFSTSQNLKIKEIEKYIKMDIKNPKGVIYNNSNIWAKRLFIFAHLSYWSARRTFAKGIEKTLIKGYEFQYKE